MCLIVLPGEKVRIAEKPITVYKVVQKFFWGLLAIPPYHRHFRYKRFIRHKLGSGLEITPHSIWNEDYIVREGFHAYTNELRARVAASVWIVDSVVEMGSVVEMVIPVGAEYVLGFNNEIVSNQIIWK